MTPDSHCPLPGLRPVLFIIGGVQVGSYAFFVLSGVVAAVLYQVCLCRKAGQSTQQSRAILLGALFFGSLGAKVVSAMLKSATFAPFSLVSFLYSGRTILGGLLGGWLGVIAVKRALGIKQRMGNTIAPAAALGIAIGRIGCFLGSCCYGKPTSLPVGIDFGDGVLRHPTQLYDSIFALGLFIWLSRRLRQNPSPGVLFKHFILAYCLFRFFLEWLRVEPQWFLGLTFFQIFSLLIALGVALRLKADKCKSKP